MKYIQEINGGKVEKGESLREGFKPSAPADLVLPKPTPVPAPPQPNEGKE